MALKGFLGVCLPKLLHQRIDLASIQPEVHSYFADPLLAQALGIFQNFHLIDLTIQDDAQMQQNTSLGLQEALQEGIP